MIRKKSVIVRMSDPLSEIIALLRPQAPYSKLVDAAGPWRVRRTEVGRVYYAMVLSGRTRMALGDRPPFTLEAGDFVLVPAAFRFLMSSLDPPPPPDLDTLPVPTGDGTVRVGGTLDVGREGLSVHVPSVVREANGRAGVGGVQRRRKLVPNRHDMNVISTGEVGADADASIGEVVKKQAL